MSVSMLASCSVIEGILGTDSSKGESNREDGYKYTDFTDEEKKILTESVGRVIPFIPCNKYYFEGIYDKADFGDGVKYYTTGSTRADFDNYVKLYANYEFSGTYVDNFGDTWDIYKSEGITVNISYYFYSGVSYIDVLVYPTADTDDNNGGNTDSGNTDSGNADSGNTDSGNTNSGNTDSGNNNTGSGDGGTTTETGYRAIDFTKATKVKDVTEQGFYLGGCPTKGSPKVLVIPVEFSDETASSNGYTVDAIKEAWYGDSQSLDYYSVDEYYYQSSYGQLDLDITVLDYWFRPEKTSTYYAAQTMNFDGEEMFIGDQMVMDEALEELSKTMDLSDFDSDNNDMIDAVVLINTLEIDYESDFQWAFRYWNMYTDNEGYYYEYDGVSANDYLWASYKFMYETYDDDGNVDYNGTKPSNTYTYIHEFGHVLGADDYYDYNDTTGESSPLEGCDVMDYMIGDHNAYTKFHYGWVTESRLVSTTTSITLTLEAFSENGDTIIIANNWSDDNGAYQEYYIVVYYTMDGLNGGEFGYFENEGIVVYHVNATLEASTENGQFYYDLMYNNNSIYGENYGTEHNLIEFVKTSRGNIVFGVGDSLPTVKDDSGNSLGYTFKVDSLDGDTATITFTKR